MRTFAICNRKGGVGKSSTAVNLAACLAELGRRVLVVDMDPQGTAGHWLQVEDAKGRDSLRHALVEEGAALVDLMRPAPAVSGVDVVPSSPGLAKAERELDGVAFGELRRLLLEVPAGRWDYVLIDTPPALGMLTINAMVAACRLLVPVEPSSMAVPALASLKGEVQRLERGLRVEIEIAGVLLWRADLRETIARQVREALEQAFPSALFQAVIRPTVRLREAPSHGKPINLYDPRGKGAEDFRAVARELVTRCEDQRPAGQAGESLGGEAR